jgi:hypothetical protein
MLRLHKLILNSITSSPLRTARVVLEHGVHLLESTSASFGNEEVGPDEGEDTEDCEEDVCAVACVLDERGCDEALFLLVTGVSAVRKRGNVR